MKLALQIFFLILFFSAGLYGQQISIDHGIRAAGLWCFPLASDSLTFLYLPSDARLATDENNKPQFSFMRYVNNEKSQGASENAITTAGGGAVLNFLILYETPEKKIAAAKEALKKNLNNDNITIKGPLIFSNGRYALISSIVNPSDASEQKKLLAIGNAPVLEGSRIALSFELDPKSSKILLESFKMSTPDISIVFDMSFSGLTDAYNASLTVNWDNVKKSESMNAGGSIYFVSADVEKSVEELKRNNAIQLTTVGKDENMETLVNNVNAKVVELLFQEIDPEKQPADQQTQLNSMVGLTLISNTQSESNFKISPFSVHAAYKRRDYQNSGKSVMNFNSRATVERHHLITFNIGDFYKKYGNNTEFFKSISLDDPDFQQREIYVSVDGTLLPEFEKMINNITVTLRKKHESGETTIRELNITKNVLNENKMLPLIYGSIGDKDRTAWLNYEYKASYQFIGGMNYETEWLTQSTAMINVYAPYASRKIQIDGDPQKLKNKNIRAVVVQLEYPFFKQKKNQQINVKPDENFAEKFFNITLPVSEYGYNYKLTWISSDGQSKTFSAKDDSGIIFIDNISN